MRLRLPHELRESIVGRLREDSMDDKHPLVDKSSDQWLNVIGLRLMHRLNISLSHSGHSGWAGFFLAGSLG